MKQKDITLVILVIFVTAIFSFLVSNLIFGSPSDRQQTAEVVDPITDEFRLPDEKYFNKDSINPTQEIQIGEEQNPNPFDGASQ